MVGVLLVPGGLPGGPLSSKSMTGTAPSVELFKSSQSGSGTSRLKKDLNFRAPALTFRVEHGDLHNKIDDTLGLSISRSFTSFDSRDLIRS